MCEESCLKLKFKHGVGRTIHHFKFSTLYDSTESIIEYIEPW